jgi:hypothetical protein
MPKMPPLSESNVALGTKTQTEKSPSGIGISTPGTQSLAEHARICVRRPSHTPPLSMREKDNGNADVL